MRIKGFTLIELVIVLLISCIILSFALLNYGDFGGQRSAITSVKQFASYLKFLQRISAIEGQCFGINLTDKGYITYHFTDNKSWRKIQKIHKFRPRPFPKNLIVSTQEPLKALPQTPRIQINPFGEITAFHIYFGLIKTPKLIALISDGKGHIHLEKISP